jgi:hypothetical protein
MKLEKFNSLKKEIEEKTFESEYFVLEKILFYGSFLGNILSIVLGYVYLNELMSQAAMSFKGQSFVLPIVIVLFLGLFELLKRFMFGKLTLNWLISPVKLSLKNLSSILFMLVLIIGTFFLTIGGAKKFVDKNEQIINTTDSTLTFNIDSLNKTYNLEIEKIENKIQYIYNVAQYRKRKSLTTEEIKNIKLWEQDIKDLKKERDIKIKTIESKLKDKASYQIEKSNKTQTTFILLSAFIELIILIGVGFRSYFTFVTYTEAKEKYKANKNYQKYLDYSKLLDILYTKNKFEKGMELISQKKFEELVQASGNYYTKNIIKNFLTLLNHLEITKIDGGTRRALKSKEEALTAIKEYFNLV